jgi:hypothetical protein
MRFYASFVNYLRALGRPQREDFGLAAMAGKMAPFLTIKN